MFSIRIVTDTFEATREFETVLAAVWHLAETPQIVLYTVKEIHITKIEESEDGKG